MSYEDPKGYERFMGRWSVNLAPQFIEFAALRDGGHVIDVGCGTGILSAAVSERYQNTIVRGMDSSAAFIGHARRFRARSRITFEVGDGLALPYSSDSFQACLSLLVLQALPDAASGMEEMRRVTISGGTIAGAIWDFRDGMPMFSLLSEAMLQVVPEEANDFRKPPKFGSRSIFSRLWREAGLMDVIESDLRVTLDFDNFDDFWQPFLAGATPRTARVAQLDGARRQQVADHIRGRLPNHQPDRPFTLTATAWTVKGKVP